jgi:spore coat protein CotH
VSRRDIWIPVAVFLLLSAPASYLWPLASRGLERAISSVVAPVLLNVSPDVVWMDPETDDGHTLVLENNKRKPVELAVHETSAFAYPVFLTLVVAGLLSRPVRPLLSGRRGLARIGIAVAALVAYNMILATTVLGYVAAFENRGVVPPVLRQVVPPLAASQMFFPFALFALLFVPWRRTRRLAPAVSLAVIAQLVLAEPSPAVEYHANCGEPSDPYVASDGTLYLPDRPYTSGSWGYVGGDDFVSDLWSPSQLVGTPDPTLYLTARTGNVLYRFTVPSGEYLVTLRLAEIELHGGGLRRFRCRIEGQIALSNVDLWSRVEKDHAIDFRFHATVTDGVLDVDFDPIVDAPIVCAIDVAPGAPDAIGPAAPADLAALGGYERAILSWSPPADGDVAGHRVYRSPEAAGTYTLLADLGSVVDHYFDDDVAAGETRYYKVSAVDAYGNEGPTTPAEAATPLAIDETELPAYEIVLDPDSLAVLNADVYADDYVLGTLRRDETVVPDAGIRYQGNSSRRFNKKSYKLRFGPGVVFEGRDRLNLVASYGEPTLLANVLGFWVLSQTRVPFPQAFSSHVQLNGTYRGVFTNIEEIDERFLDRVGLDEESNLYRADHNLSVLSGPEEYEARYEKITNPATGHDDLIAFIEAINHASDADFPAVAAELLDVDEYLDYYATEILLANFDFTHRDYFMYHDAATGKWWFLAWDLDSTLWDKYGDIARGTAGHPDFSGINVLMDRMMRVPAFRYAFCQKLIDAMATTFTPSEMNARIDEAYAIIAGDASVDPYKLDHLDNATFAARPAGLKSFVTERRNYLQSVVYDYMPDLAGVVQINEFMALNATTIADEFGQFEDWIELYNGGSAPIDLGGMYLSDDLASSTKWRLPSLSLAPGEFALIWADGDTLQGPWHANFRLDADGEEIGLFDRIENGNVLIDSIVFGAQTADVSQGRYPDGAESWEPMPLPTPGSANISGGTPPPIITTVEHEPGEPAATDTVWVRAAVVADTLVQTVLMSWRVNDGSFMPTQMVDDGEHHDGGDGDGVFGVLIPPFADGTDITYFVEAADAAGGHAISPPAAPDELYGYTVGYRVPALRLNEILASNAGTITDEFGDYDDWIELTSLGSAPLSLSGLYLTDDLSVPDRWALPDTTLEPGEYLLVWADGEPEEGPLHAGFRLSADGEELALVDFNPAVPALVDSVTFGAQTTDISFGRLPDGTGDWILLPNPTPGYANDSAIAVDPLAAGEPARVDLRVRPHPVSRRVTIQAIGEGIDGGRIGIYDVSGRQVHVLPLPTVVPAVVTLAWDGADADGRRLAPGVYFLRLESARGGTRATTRVVIVR